ncbi:MAG TPA: hypothetical protein VFZ89_14365 [Solirubrobacteraceae bacterium]
MEPEDLLSDTALQAAVGALAARNQHHLAEMTPQEQEQALEHWRTLAMDVLVAARAATGHEAVAPPVQGGPGRAVIVLEDSGEEDVSVHVTFHPELEELGDDQVAGTPAQITAVAMIEHLSAGEDGQPGAE